MTTTPDLFSRTGLATAVRPDHLSVLDALQQTAVRNARLWRRVSDYDVPVPGLKWTAAETAAHLVGDLRDYTEVLTRYARGYVTHPQLSVDSPSRMSAVVNARHLLDVPERNLHRLSVQLENAVAAYVSVAATVEAGVPMLTPNGLVIDAATMTGLLLAEQLIHGLDIARACERDWTIERHEALLAVPAVLAVAPEYLRPDQAQQQISFEIRLRGGAAYRFAVLNGSATLDAAGAPVDCVITADPAAFLMVGFGRLPQRAAALRGKMWASGRRPWCAITFGSLLSHP